MDILTISLFLNVFFLGIIAAYLVPLIILRPKPKTIRKRVSRRPQPQRRTRTRSRA
jgi:hypothetical protein